MIIRQLTLGLPPTLLRIRHWLDDDVSFKLDHSVQFLLLTIYALYQFRVFSRPSQMIDGVLIRRKRTCCPVTASSPFRMRYNVIECAPLFTWHNNLHTHTPTCARACLERQGFQKCVNVQGCVRRMYYMKRIARHLFIIGEKSKY